MVLGATNRPQDIDTAIQRRLPRSFEIGLPDAAQRQQILSLLLKTERVDPAHLEHMCSELASKTHGYSGSDLKELCRAALMIPIRELARRDDAPKAPTAPTTAPEAAGRASAHP